MARPSVFIVFAFLLRLSRSRTVAEDLLDETWLRLVRHAAMLRPDTRIGPWLFTVARNLYWSHRRACVIEETRERLDGTDEHGKLLN